MNQQLEIAPTMESFSARLLRRRRGFDPLLFAAFRELAEARFPREALVSYFVQMYHYIRFSVPLMKRAKQALPSEPAAIRLYFEQHEEEESGHEEWVLNDLASFGVSRASVVNSLPAPETVAMVGSQFYMIEEVSAISFLGYMFALESSPPTEWSIRKVEETFGVPRSSLSALVGHAEADPHHVQDICELLDAHVPENQRPLIEYNMDLSVRNLRGVIAAAARDG